MNQYSINKLPSDVLLEFAQKHRKLRKQKKLSQSELAVRSGVSLGSVKRFESSGKISLESLLKLAYILDRLEDFSEVFVISPQDNIKSLFRNENSNR